jgi:hypothetical protein
MATDDTENTHAGEREPVGRSIVLSYRELVELRTEISEVKSMLTAALALQGAVTDHEKRISRLERGEAAKEGRRSAWVTILAFFGGMASALIGGGALQYLPTLLGSH